MQLHANLLNFHHFVSASNLGFLDVEFFFVLFLKPRPCCTHRQRMNGTQERKELGVRERKRNYRQEEYSEARSTLLLMSASTQLYAVLPRREPHWLQFNINILVTFIERAETIEK